MPMERPWCQTLTVMNTSTPSSAEACRTAAPADVDHSASGPSERRTQRRVRRVWDALLWVSEKTERAVVRVCQWLLRVVLRGIRAFLAGAGAFAFLALLGALSIGVDSVGTKAMLYFIAIGGGVGVVIQRTFKKFAFLRKLARITGVDVVLETGAD